MLTFYEKYRSNLYSQNGEDGIIAEILRRLESNSDETEILPKMCCEFGGGDGNRDSNTAKLIHEGWTGIFMEQDDELSRHSKKYWGGRENVVNICMGVTPANVNFVVRDPVTVLSIDIDGNDYHVWKALTASPTIVVIEINSSLHPLQDHVSLGKGSNFSAMLKLGVLKGYFLICHTGNLVFVNNKYQSLFSELIVDQNGNLFYDTTNPAIQFIYPKYVSLVFNTAWLATDMIRDWEAPAAAVHTPAPLPPLRFADEVAAIPSNKLDKVGILVTATWKFTDFLPQLFQSLSAFVPTRDKVVFLFTDSAEDFAAQYTTPGMEVVQIHVPDERYPEVSLYRYRRYLAHMDKYSAVEYLFHLDADMQIIAVGEEILQPLVAVQHPLFIPESGGGGSFENKVRSTAYIDHNTAGVTYVCGGIQGGQKAQYLAACSLLSYNIDQDVKDAVMAEWHDESHWNWYCERFATMVKILDAGYCYPQEKTLPPKYIRHIIALDKDKQVYR